MPVVAALRCEETLLGYFFQPKVVPAGVETDEKVAPTKQGEVLCMSIHYQCQCRYIYLLFL